MRILNFLTDRQEEVGLTFVKIGEEQYELRNPKGELIVAYLGKPDKQSVQKDGWEYLKGYKDGK
jgi:hypothetical protein